MQNNPDVVFQQALQYQNEKKFEKAIELYQKILTMAEDHYEALINLANLYRQTGKAIQALPYYQRAITANPGVFEGYFNLGLALFDLDRFEAVIKSVQLALKYNPGFKDALLLLGHAYRKQGHFEHAKNAFEGVLKLSASSPEALMGLGYTFHESLDSTNALKMYNRVITMNPDNADAHWNKATLLLLNGRFSEGWQEFQWRKKLPNFPNFGFSQPEWNGSELKGKRILLVTEQGYGDSIQFLRFCKKLKELDAYVIVSTKAPLLELFRHCPWVDKVKLSSDPVIPFDTYLSIMSLAAVLNVAEDEIPGEVPYFYVDDKALPDQEFNQGQLKVGLAWGGNPRNSNNRRRSCSLSSWQPFLNIPNIQFYSFQVGPQKEDLNKLNLENKIINLSPRIGNFLDTAIFMQKNGSDNNCGFSTCPSGRSSRKKSLVNSGPFS